MKKEVLSVFYEVAGSAEQDSIRQIAGDILSACLSFELSSIQDSVGGYSNLMDAKDIEKCLSAVAGRDCIVYISGGYNGVTCQFPSFLLQFNYDYKHSRVSFNRRECGITAEMFPELSVRDELNQRVAELSVMKAAQDSVITVYQHQVLVDSIIIEYHHRLTVTLEEIRQLTDSVRHDIQEFKGETSDDAPSDDFLSFMKRADFVLQHLLKIKPRFEQGVLSNSDAAFLSDLLDEVSELSFFTLKAELSPQERVQVEKKYQEIMVVVNEYTVIMNKHKSLKHQEKTNREAKLASLFVYPSVCP